jgi:hypothetical protein
LQPIVGNSNPKTIESIKLEGIPKGLEGHGVVFDVYYGAFLTAGTRNGRPFELTAWPDTLNGQISAKYSSPVGVLPPQPNCDMYGIPGFCGDIYATLDISLGGEDGTVTL